MPPSLAHGQTSDSCRLRVESDRSSFSEAWQRAIAALERELQASPATTCHGIELVVLGDGDAVRVVARAPGGERARRRVDRPAGLSAVAFGLLVVAPGEAPPPEPDPLDLPPPDEPRPLPLPVVPSWQLAIGAAVGARVVFRTDVLVSDFDVRADLLVHDWLLTFDLRASPVVLALRGTYDSDAYNEVAVGLGLGRQARVGRSVFALSGVANVTNVWLENDANNAADERAQLRLGVLARWGYSIGRLARLNLMIDAEAAPFAFFDGPPAQGLPPFPTFTIGLRLGAEMLL